MAKKSDKTSPEVEAAARVNAAYKKTLVRTLSDDPEPVPTIPTGVPPLDRVLGVGGLARGRIVELYGPVSSGKTTLMLHAVAAAQSVGSAAFVDAEHALDTNYAKVLGVDLGRLLISQPDCGEEALEAVDLLCGEVDLVVVDSVAALTPRDEIEGNFGDPVMGSQARMMSQGMRKIASKASKRGTTVVFINQIRSKIGGYGSPETTPGGDALKFYASARIEVRRMRNLQETTEGSKQTVGIHAKVKGVKNKLAPPFKEAEFDILFGRGVDTALELLDRAVEAGVVEQNGTWFSFGGERLAHGRLRVREELVENADLRARIEQAIETGEVPE